MRENIMKIFLVISSSLIGLSYQLGRELADCPKGSEKDLVYHEVVCPRGPSQIGLFRGGGDASVMTAAWFQCGDRTQIGSGWRSITIPASHRGGWILGRPEPKGRVGDIWFSNNNPNRAILQAGGMWAIKSEEVTNVKVGYICMYGETWVNQIQFLTKSRGWVSWN